MNHTVFSDKNFHAYNSRVKTVFLDRDGTINVDKNYLHRIEDFEFLQGAVEGLKMLYDFGCQLVVITNQSGIARGYFTEEEYLRLDGWMQEQLKKSGIVLAKSYYCPHLPDGIVPRYAVKCSCRKPGLELFYRAVTELSVDLAHSYVIGDRMRDLKLCEKFEVQGILLADDEIDVSGCSNIIIKKSLLEAAEYIINAETQQGSLWG